MKALRTLTISERVQVTKYPQTIVGPFWGHGQLLQSSSCLRWKKKKIQNSNFRCDRNKGRIKTLGTGGQRVFFERRMGYGM